MDIYDIGMDLGIKRSRMKALQMILRLILFTIFVLILYMIILKLTGHSPTLDVITITILTLIVGGLTKLMADFYGFKGKAESHMEVTKNTFIKMGSKLDKLDNDVNELKSDMKLIKHKLKIYN